MNGRAEEEDVEDIDEEVNAGCCLVEVMTVGSG